MILRIMYLLILTLVFCVNAVSKDAAEPEISWSVKPAKENFQKEEPIIISYEIKNISTSDIWVLRSPDAFASVRLRLFDPYKRLMKWEGARFTFRYDQSDLVKLKPGESTSGTFTIPSRCSGKASFEKGGFCFEQRGTYEGTAQFRMGMNAFYHREQLPGRLAEGPYSSKAFKFVVQ